MTTVPTNIDRTEHSNPPYTYDEILEGIKVSESQIESGDYLTGGEIDLHIEHLSSKWK